MMITRVSVSKKLVGLVLVAGALLMVLLLAGCQQQKPESESAPAPAPAKQQEALEVSDPQQKSPDPAYVLILGDDSWEKYTPGRSDMMMLMRVDFERDQITFVSIPRDTSCTWTDGSTIKANMAYQLEGGGAAGAEAACVVAKEITGVAVDDYLIVGFDGLQSIVERFGGLDATLPYDLTYSFYTHDYPDELYTAGDQLLTPWRTMALSRARTGYAPYGVAEDMMRLVVDRQMLAGLTQCLFKDSTQTVAVMQELMGTVQTNIPAEDLVAWATDLTQAEQLQVYGTSGPFDGGIDAETEMWLVPRAPEKWKALMDVVDAGGDPATVDVQFEGSVQSEIAPINSATVVEVG